MSIVKSNRDIADFIRDLAREADTFGLVRVTAEQLNDWANAINPDGFIVTGLDTAGLVRHMAERGLCHELLKEVCGVFGMALEASEEVQNTLRVKFAISDTTRELIRQLVERDRKGLAKYGTTLDRSDLTRNEWLQHMTEELLDAAGYAQAAKRT